MAVVTVNPLPASITGTTYVCSGMTSALSDAGSGTWVSANPAIAAIDGSTGIVSGVANGTTTVTYTIATGCRATTTITVNTIAVISGAPHVCSGLTRSLGDVTTGAIWSSSNASVAAINTSGLVTGVAPGSATISYSLSASCFVTTSFVVDTLPTPIAGNTGFCQGTTLGLTDAGGGTWTSLSPGIAAVGTSSGTVLGVSPGTATIVYTLGTGCVTNTVVTVHVLPATISGIDSVCVGLTNTLSDGVSGGTWVSALPAVASVDPSAGVVTGITAGTATIVYLLSTGCTTSVVVTIDPLPSVIAGPPNVCTGTSVTLSDATSGGAWTSGNSLVAAVGSGSGMVSGLSGGAATITYKLSTGCISTRILTVNATPPAITGTPVVCTGLSTILSDAMPGGVWTSNDITIAAAGSSGMISGVAPGSVTITYTIPSVVGTSCYTTNNVTVNPLPSAILGPVSVCTGAAITLTEATPGGAWTSSNASVGTVLSGNVSGISPGSVTITYTLPTGCISTKSVTVYATPPAITGTTQVCIGLTTTLTDAAGSGAWTSSNTAIATADPLSGAVTGITNGAAAITYTVAAGCFATANVTVNPLPSAITGTDSVCVGSSVILSDAGLPGTWSSGATGIAATGSSSGIVNGISAGTAVITYTLPTGCIATTIVTVDPLPAAITGVANVCVGSVTTLSDATAGGVWGIAGSSGEASVSLAGSVTGLIAGSTTVWYALSTSCRVSFFMTINPLPAIPTGADSVCVGATTALSDTSPGGIWSSSGSASVATISGSGIVTGLSAGTLPVTYTLPTSCRITIPVTVNPLPFAITSPGVVCVGFSITLTDAAGGSGATWSSSNASIATVGSTSGVVTGNAPGTATITYTLSTGCRTTTIVTVNSVPVSIVGTTHLCAGSNATLTDATTGGTWSSSAPGICTVTSAGTIFGLSPGTATITYGIEAGCYAATIVSVNQVPALITGPSVVCTSAGITLGNAVPGGTWSSVGSSGAVSVGSSTGIVSGLVAGSAILTYTLPPGCSVTTVINVNASPSPISGASVLCAASQTTLSCPTPGGAWSSSNPAIATIGPSTGVVSGVSAGSATISYIVSSTGCFSVRIVSVNPLPAAITGTTHICTGLVSTLADSTAGGTWSSTPGSSGIAIVNAVTGLVTAVAPGSLTVTYALPTSCFVTTSVIVNPSPAAITGTMNVCVGSARTLTDATTGGAWSSSDGTRAIVGAGTGIVVGVSAGTAAISYTLPTGCLSSNIIIVNPLPAVITGNRNVCLGQSTTFTDSLTGGSWSSGAPGIASVGLVSGTIGGLALGNAIITYTIPTGCVTTTTVTVDPLPQLIAGTNNVCEGSSAMLVDLSPSGAWSSHDSSIAAVGVLSGVVTGISGGTTVISYTLPTGCLTSITFTVRPAAPVTGPSTVCAGSSIVLADSTAGGFWTSSTGTVATIGSADGETNGVASGTTIITYNLGTGCFRLYNVTVNPQPIPYNVTGGGSYCSGGAGVHVGLYWGDTGVVYKLYDGASFITSLPGAYSPLDFGLQTAPGTYTVLATRIGTGCPRIMSGSAVVSLLPTVPPSVTISSATGDTACAGASVVFSATTVNAGSLPICRWYVDGIYSGSGNPYTLVPANGDTISCTVTAVATCSSVDTAAGSLVMSVQANEMPVVTITASPGDTVCPLTPATFTASEIYGGSSPSYRWMKNGLSVGSGLTYSVTPSTGDHIYCEMRSNYTCRQADSVASATASMFVVPVWQPTVSISAHPGLGIASGHNDTLTAVVAGAVNPGYQWAVNGVAVPGANTSVLIDSNFLNNDSVTCRVTDTGACGVVDTAVNVIISVWNVGIHQITTVHSSVAISPNPNNGTFVLSGQIDAVDDLDILLEITDVTGQSIHKKHVVAFGGKLNETIVLDKTLANGIYLLSLHSPALNNVFQVILNK